MATPVPSSISTATTSAPLTAEEKAKSKYFISEKEPFNYEWSKYLHRVKLHELLRILQREDMKLKILESGGAEEMTKLLGGEELSGIGENFENLIFMRTLQEEQDLADDLAQRVRNAERQRDFVSRAALRLFKSKQKMTKEQFETILNMCKDKAERRLLRTAYEEKVSREAYLHNATEMQQMMYSFLNSHFFNRFLLFLIAASTAIIVLLTFEFIEIRYTFPLRICDSLIISVFVVEAICKITIYKLDYFKSFWNIVDLSIIITHFVEVIVELVTKLLALNTDINRSIIFRLLKSLRSLRLIRTIKFLPNLQVIVSTIFQSLLSLGSIALLMGIIIIVFAVVGRGLFKEEDPRHFKSIWSACLTLFQLLTLDDWYDLPDDFDRAGNTATAYTIFILYLFVYILFEYFVFLNLFVAVLVDNFQLSLDQAQVGQGHGISHRLRVALEQLRMLEEAEGLLEEKDKKQDPKDITVGDYYKLERDSEELKLIAENLKTMSSMDYHYQIFRRRMNLTGLVLDAAVEKKLQTWMSEGTVKYDVHKLQEYGPMEDEPIPEPEPETRPASRAASKKLVNPKRKSISY